MVQLQVFVGAVELILRLVLGLVLGLLIEHELVDGCEHAFVGNELDQEVLFIHESELFNIDEIAELGCFPLH